MPPTATRAATARSTCATASDHDLTEPELPSAREARWIGEVDERVAEYGELFNSVEHARATGRAHVVCLGDSHLSVFYAGLHPEVALHEAERAWFDPYMVTGATARGLTNPFSQTNALNIFRRRLEFAAPWQPVVFQLGEVDCGFLIWYRAKEHGKSVESELEETLDHYTQFLGELRVRGFERVIALTAPLPTVRDAHDWKGRLHARRHIDVSQRDRTDLTLRYNEQLARRADGFTVLDVTTPTLDPVTRLVAPEFVRPDPSDHHMAPEPYGRVIADRLLPLVGPP